LEDSKILFMYEGAPYFKRTRMLDLDADSEEEEDE
jgi:hypothetical protein